MKNRETDKSFPSKGIGKLKAYSIEPDNGISIVYFIQSEKIHTYKMKEEAESHSNKRIPTRVCIIIIVYMYVCSEVSHK